MSGSTFITAMPAEEHTTAHAEPKPAAPVSSVDINALIEKEVEQQQSLSEQRHQQHLIVDVYGRASEPICTYHRCSHKFSSWFRQLQV